MKIPDRIVTTFTQPAGPQGGRGRIAAPDFAKGDVQNISLPSLLELTEAEHPAREAYLTALSQSLRDGLYRCDPERVAEALLSRGLDSEAL